MYQDEEDTVGPIRKFAQQACDNAKPGSPLYQLQQMDSHNTAPMFNGISKDLLDEAITLLFAGQDTSAATLSWTLHLLSLYPTVQSKLAEEVQMMLTEEEDLDKDAPTVTKKMISKLPFLDAVVKESMRLYPVAPFVVRQLTHDLPLAAEEGEQQHKTTLPAGALACIWIYGLHRNPKFWNRPNEFLPERWIDPALKDIGLSNGAYLPFASGPRNCVGQPLAHVVLRTLLTRLVHKFDFRDERLDNGSEACALLKDMQAGFTVLPSGGVMLEIRDRYK
jgi:cytochrome P450